MKIDRLIGILSVLLQEEKVTAPELAKTFEPSMKWHLIEEYGAESFTELSDGNYYLNTNMLMRKDCCHGCFH